MAEYEQVEMGFRVELPSGWHPAREASSGPRGLQVFFQSGKHTLTIRARPAQPEESTTEGNVRLLSRDLTGLHAENLEIREGPSVGLAQSMVGIYTTEKRQKAVFSVAYDDVLYRFEHSGEYDDDMRRAMEYLLTHFRFPPQGQGMAFFRSLAREIWRQRQGVELGASDIEKVLRYFNVPIEQPSKKRHSE
jgi:hypothetical protein